VLPYTKEDFSLLYHQNPNYRERSVYLPYFIYDKLSIITFTIIQERAASAKPQRAMIIVSRHFVLSCWSDPKRIL